MKTLKAPNEVILSIWETELKLRNKNNEIQCVVNVGTTIDVGDVIIGGMMDGGVSTYEVLEIVETRPAALSNKTLYKLKTHWAKKAN